MKAQSGLGVDYEVGGKDKDEKMLLGLMVTSLYAFQPFLTSVANQTVFFEKYWQLTMNNVVIQRWLILNKVKIFSLFGSSFCVSVWHTFQIKNTQKLILTLCVFTHNTMHYIESWVHVFQYNICAQICIVHSCT